MKLFQNLILFTVLLFVHGQEVVLTPPTIDDTGEEQTSNWDTAPVLADLADGNGWTAPEYYSTIRVHVVDQTIWLLARGNDGMHAYKYDSASKTWDTSPPLLPDLADSNDWNAGPEYYSTIQVVGSDSIWLLARNADGLQVYQYDLFNRAWTQKTALASLSDANSWNQEEYYSSIQAFAISGAILVFVRDPSGEIVNIYDLDSDSWTPAPALAAFSDARNWGSDPKYYSTVQVVQLGQDFWLLGRSATGMEIAQYTNSWTQKTPLPDLSDANGWGDAEYYSTIKAVALDGNIWLFARNADGLQTYQYETESDTWTPKKSLDDLSDLNGWGSVEYYSTIQPVALSTSIALLARGPNGLQYYEYLPNSDSWDSKPTLTALSDAQNWNRPEYYTTIKGINYMDVVNVAARGIYGEELYSYKA